MAAQNSWKNYEDLASSARTATANGAGRQFNEYNHGTMLVDCTSADAGTLDVHVQVSHDGTTWYDLYDTAGNLVNVPQITTTVASYAVAFIFAGGYVRARGVQAASPNHTYSVRFMMGRN